MEEFNAIQTIMQGGFVITALFAIYLILKLILAAKKPKNGSNGSADKKSQYIICPLDRNGTEKQIAEIFQMAKNLEKENKSLMTTVDNQVSLFKESHADMHLKVDWIHDRHIETSGLLKSILAAIEKQNDLMLKILTKGR